MIIDENYYLFGFELFLNKCIEYIKNPSIQDFKIPLR